MSRAVLRDTAIAAVVLAVSLAVLAARGLGRPDPNANELDWLGGVLAAAAAAPLLIRSRAPLTSYLLSSAFTIALVGAKYPIDFPFGPAVALYTVASTYAGDPNPRRRKAAIALGIAFVPVALIAFAAGGHPLSGLAAGMLFWLLTLVGISIAGDRARLRRERMLELEERAARARREAEHERRLAAAEERTRIARELHDSAGHAINVILVQAGAARLLHSRDQAASQRAIATIEDVARNLIGEIDELVTALRDDDDTHAPTDPAALDQLFDQHRLNGLEVQARTEGSPQHISRSAAYATYRILQEGLTNAARHGPGTAEVELRFDTSAVDVTITNPTSSGDSSVPNGSSAPNGGHGVIGMRERATLLGGTLDAEQSDGRFRVHAHLPYHQPA